MAMSGMRDRFVDKPVEYILHSCKELAELADAIVQCVDDSLLLQPSSLELATLKKRPGDHLVSPIHCVFILHILNVLEIKFLYFFIQGFYLVPSVHGILQVGELKCNSAAHQSGKIETGDEIVQINYQTVVSILVYF